MAEDVDRVDRERLVHLIEPLHPAARARAAGTVDVRIEAVENQVAHVHHVGLLEHDDGVAARMRGAEILRGDDLVAAIVPPCLGKGRVGKHLLVEIAALLRRGELQFRHVDLRHDCSGGRFEDRVAAGVIVVVVRVDDRVEPASRAARQAGEADRGRVGKLRVDHDERRGRGQPADGAAAAGEDPGMAAQRLEFSDGRFRRRGRRTGRGRGGLGAQEGAGQQAGGGQPGGTKEEIAAIHGVRLAGNAPE